MGGMPIIRLEIEQMRHCVLSHLAQYNKEIEGMVSEEIDRVIKNIDLRAEVRKHMVSCITGAVESYFKYGDGSKAVKDAVWESLTGQE